MRSKTEGEAKAKAEEIQTQTQTQTQTQSKAIPIAIGRGEGKQNQTQMQIQQDVSTFYFGSPSFKLAYRSEAKAGKLVYVIVHSHDGLHQLSRERGIGGEFSNANAKS